MSQPSKTYPYTDLTVLAQKVKAAGGPQIDPSQTTGKASADGVTIGWSVDSSTKHITLTILAKPWIVPVGTIWSHADELFEV